MYITRDFQQVPHQQHVFLLYHINDLRFHWILTSKWFQSSYTALIQVIWTLNYCFEGFTDWQWGQFGEWGVTRQTGDELKLRYKCEYVVIVEKVPHVGEKVQEEKKDAKSKPHTLLSKTCSAWQERRGQNDITKTDIAPLTRTIYSRTGTSEGSSNTGCSWSTPALGKSTDAAVVSKQPAQPPWLGSPCWGPYSDPAWLGFQGVCGARPLRICMKKRGRNFLFFDLISHRSSPPGTGTHTCVSAVLSRGAHTVNWDTAVCVLWLLEKNIFQAPIDFLNKLTFKS